MAEEESAHVVDLEERPQTARKDSRKLPGGFDKDDVDDLSPNKEDSRRQLSENSNAFAQNQRVPSFNPGSLPQLPPPGDSSLLYNQSENGGSEINLGGMDDSAMERHLNDVESSFMPVNSPLGVPGNSGYDDTFLFDRGGSQTGTESPVLDKKSTTLRSGESIPESPPTPPNAYKTPAPAFDDSVNVGDTTSSLETMSSPTAAAAARTVSRAISMASAGYDLNDGTNNENHDQSDSENDARVDLEATPRKRKTAAIDDAFDKNFLRRQSSNLSLNQYDAGSTPGAALFGNKSSGNSRPKFLRSRHSKHSSVSSFVTNPESHDGSEATLGADYALQSGGAVPAGGFSRNSSMALSRSISLGSMASAMDEDRADYIGRSDASLATLTEEEQNRRATEKSPPSTPRATSRSLAAAAPTDTIIARHVRNVQVPESLAKEYRNKSGATSPKRSSGFATSTLGRNGKNLTLKEQSSTIERLSKENFDLKLKVMFLSDRLDKLSEEGVKEMISENVELKTGLAVMQRDNKALKRKVKDLEKQLKDDEERPSTAVSGTSVGESPKWFDQEGAQEREEELIYLRERVEEYVTEIEKLRNDSVIRENEKRNLAEVVRNMGERRSQNLDAREEMDVWKDLLEQETSRREQADEDNKKLRDEIFRLRTEPGSAGLNHTTNIYNITKKRQMSPSRPISGLSNHIDDRNGTSSAASTLVEELRRESEQLRHENAELRREVGAQTNMLTSRNREKERLYQEIEDLKLGQRRGGGSIAGDSIFERSASRAHQRSLSRTSAGTRQTVVTDTDREDLENKNAELRDSINGLKIQNQDLQRELESCMEDFETAVAQKKQAETLANEMQEALEVAENDLLTMQADRDEALQGQEEAELMFESLRKEAQEELDGFAAEAEEASVEIERLQNELQDTTENFNALQNEMREMSEALVRLEDDHEAKARRIQELESEIDESNKELEQMEKNLVESNGKIDRLSVQQESCQGEIAFLREEQDGDKIKIGDLEAALKHADKSLAEEAQRAKDLDQRLGNERHQREVIASKEKQEIQQYVNNLNREITNAQDEARRLRKSLSNRETEAAEWKSRLTDLENNLREALGDLNGTRSSMFTSIAKLQGEVENSSRELSTTRGSLAEKERLIKHRDSLLESHGLESRKLADMLDKERQAHRTTKHQFETFQKTQQHTTRTLTQQESRVLELETARQNDRRKMVTMENQFKDQMTERNNLLLQLWNRLSALCGSDWAHNNSLINGRALPSLEAVTNMLPGFSKNLLNAIKTIETLISDFKSRIRQVEKDLWKEYHILEGNLEHRTKRLDRLETLTRSAIPSISSDGRAEIAKLRDVNRLLRGEVSALRSANDVLTGVHGDATSPAPSVPSGPRHKAAEKASRNSTLTRHQSASAVETYEQRISTAISRSGSSSRTSDNASVRERGGSFLPVTSSSTSNNNNVTSNPNSNNNNSASGSGGATAVEFPDLKWQARLKELEYKLKAEREARMIDREGARRRLEEASRENEALSREVERNKVRGEMSGGGG